MNTLSIRRAGYSDLTALAAAVGDRAFFVDRLRRQKSGLGMLFVAWLGDDIVGTVYLWLEKADEQEIRIHLRGVPLLTHLEVLTEYRKRGIGNKLIEAVEDYLLSKRGHHRVALAVQTDNYGAIRLYERRGYERCTFGPIECAKDAELLGGDHEIEECHVYVKQLIRENETTRKHLALAASAS